MSLARIFPGIGYFGPSVHDGLKLALPPETSALRISLEKAVPEILHLGQVRLLDGSERRVSLADESVDVRLSSVYEDDQRFGARSIRSGAGFHTKQELHPFLEIEWRDTPVSHVELFNRGDKFGQRSASLVVSARTSKTWSIVYRHADPDRILSLLSKVSEYLPPTLVGALLADRRYDELRGEVVESIFERLKLFPHSLNDLDWILPLIDIYGGGGALDRRLLSAYFANQLLKFGSLPSLAPAWQVLSSSQSIVESEQQIDALVTATESSGHYLFTRHGLKRSKLREKAAEYLDLLASVIGVLAESGIESFVSYGTLLGAVRDGGFIPHDDDLDLVYVGTALDVADLSERERVIRSLVDGGFTVTAKLPLLNVEVSRGLPDVSIDLFPSWQQCNSLLMYMEKMTVRPVSPEMILPLGSVEFYGQDFPAPADARRFLQERYGASWSVSDRFFEWPYPLAN